MTVSSRSKAVVDGVLQHVSVSQIQTFDTETYGGCETKWYFDKVLGEESPPTEAMKRGTALHAEIENYLVTGVDTLGPLARAGRHFMPDPREFIDIELDLEKKRFTVADVLMKGKIDVRNYSETYKDNEGVMRDDPGTIEVIDWKTSATLEYTKNANELLDSVQMVGYAEYVRTRHQPDEISEPLRRVRLSHGAFITRGKPFARKTTVTIGLDDVALKWKRVIGVVERMKITAALKTIDDVPRNLKACDAYRGCQFAKICPRNAREKLSFLNIGGNHGMSFMNRFKTAPTPDAPVMGVVVPARSNEVEAEIVKLEVEERIAKGLVTLSGPEAERALDMPKGASYQTTPALARAVGVLPPDAPRSVPELAAQPVPPEQLAGMHPAIKLAAEAFKAEGASVETVKVPVKDGAGVVSPPIVVKPKRGRPKKIVEPEGGMVPYPLASASDTLIPSGDDAADADANSIAAEDLYAQIDAAEKSRNGFGLAVDVIFDGTLVTSLEPYISNVLRALEDEYKVADIRVAPKDSVLAYGQWRGVLSALVRAQPPSSGILYAVTDVKESEIKAVIVEALRPIATTFVRAR